MPLQNIFAGLFFSGLVFCVGKFILDEGIEGVLVKIVAGLTVLFGIAASYLDCGEEWTLISREQAIVKRMPQQNEFIFNYLDLQGQRIPLLSADDEQTKKLLSNWNVTLSDVTLKKKPNDTVYCYVFEEKMFGKPTGKKKTDVFSEPIPDYEFILFYNRSEVITIMDTAVDTIRFKHGGPWARKTSTP